ncbi:hypothetical protein HK405_014212, partial [Cladochytrium tenue]
RATTFFRSCRGSGWSLNLSGCDGGAPSSRRGCARSTRRCRCSRDAQFTCGGRMTTTTTSSSSVTGMSGRLLRAALSATKPVGDWRVRGPPPLPNPTALGTAAVATMAMQDGIQARGTRTAVTGTGLLGSRWTTERGTAQPQLGNPRTWLAAVPTFGQLIWAARFAELRAPG